MPLSTIDSLWVRHRGYVLILTVVFFGILFLVSAAYLNSITATSKSVRGDVARAQALSLAEAGMDKAINQLNQGSSYSGESDTALGNGTFTVSVSSIDSKTKRITATGYIPDSASWIARKTIQANVGINGATVSFHYAIQSGNGGFELNNSSQIIGNVYSGGPVIGNNNNWIYGDVVSSGATGKVYGIHATGTVYAHALGKSGFTTVVDKDAYYTTKVNTTVGGTSFPGSADLGSAALPISDAQISQWESDAAAGGTISSCDAQGNYVVNGSASLGPKKIACNLVVKSTSGTLTVTGPLWIVGNITTQTGPTVRIDPALGSQNVAIIADNPSDQTGSGLIDVGESTIFNGSGSPSSFVFLISQNNSAETGGSTAAVTLSQSSSALVAYANHGLLSLGQSVGVKEATGYKIVLSQSASVTYDTGLPSTIFESGPGGSWQFVPGTYAITQ